MVKMTSDLHEVALFIAVCVADLDMYGLRPNKLVRQWRRPDNLSDIK